VRPSLRSLEQTIPDNLDATVARFGEREALVDVQQGIRWTYAEFATEVTRLARAHGRWRPHGRSRAVEMREKSVADLGLAAEA
jgi:hypothetical protein